MGSTLRIAAAPWPLRDDGKPMAAHTIADHLLFRIEALGMDDAEALCMDLHGNAPEDVLDGEQLADIIGWVRGAAAEAVDYLFDEPQHEGRWLPRDATLQTLDGRLWLLGGGPDGGDGYDAVVTLTAVGLL